ncbi:glycoside hydrolase family 97 C-terminal domain-containing protein [Halorhabdus tiamatea]|uniref:glycoside hydrolase family 97 C-terminal domain-containing protein n=1 Tax=Halorhabdus tiamatea TaxID=430914 RepID=UPI001F589464|nr:glycoside hydrolase family 97 C-terminal domain-containing protein [Halorhabdus tiamatea]
MLAADVPEAVPAAWDATVFVGGHLGSEATLARRRGEAWFVGSITAGPARTVEVSLLDFDGARPVTVTTDAADGSGLLEYECEISSDACCPRR